MLSSQTSAAAQTRLLPSTDEEDVEMQVHNALVHSRCGDGAAA